MKKLTIKQKLTGMTLILAALVAGLSIFFANRFDAMGQTYNSILDTRVPQYVVASTMDEVLLNSRVNMNELASVERDIANFDSFVSRVREKFQSFEVLAAAMVEGNTDLGRSIQGLDGIRIPPCRRGGAMETVTIQAKTHFAEFKDLCEHIMDKKAQILEITNTVGWYDSKEMSQGVIKTLVETAREMEARIQDNELRLLMAEIRRQEKNILQRADERYILRLKEAYKRFDSSAQGEINRLGKTYFASFESIFDKILHQEKLQAELKALVRQDLRSSQKKLAETVTALKARAHEQMVAYANQAEDMEKFASRLIIIISIVVVLLNLGLGWLISSGISKVLTTVIDNLSSGATQVAAASGQVSAASQSLAEGSSEQAASVEETSSSMEEMATMTRQNADHAGKADALMKEAVTVVGQANASMTELAESMNDISQASQETSKIIKTIDEIAFQTNLLALNAAVEAARAGEAGAGFAVVADEVRSLALRAAEAARNTSSLIEGTVQKVASGSEIMSRTSEAFGSVDESASKVGVLVSEIATASQEQAQGIEQINKAVEEMDKVIQQNAANAEESASASEELNAQAEQMNNVVNDLRALVGGKSGAFPSTAAGRKENALGPLNHPGRRALYGKATSGYSNEIDPKQLLPLEEDGFSDF